MTGDPSIPDRRETKTGLMRSLGPGLITGASDDDPSGIATYSQVGAQFGYGLLWSMLFTYPLMATIQEISARLGRVTGHGVAGNVRRHYPAGWMWSMTALLLVANVINLGADIGAMGEAVRLLVGGPALLYSAVLAGASVLLQVYVPYSRYTRILKWLTVSLFAYVATVFVVRVPWGEALRATVWPHLTWQASSVQALVAVLGTTISPYLFFWQASEEVSEMDTHELERPLRVAPEQAPRQFRRIRVDTFVGMAFSNLVAYFIILTTAAVLNARGQTSIQTAAQAAEALRPVAGPFAFVLFAAGIIGTGLLALPVLAGSAGYALGEALRWPVGLERKPYQARGFYGIIAMATLLGLTLNLLHVDPIRALYYAAILNGVSAAPVMILIMLMTSNRRVMGDFTVRGWLRVLGWLGAGVMLVAAVALFVVRGA
ncbi:NRAMP (natural resistance-associated macrophage protein)-like metal ion transporter [Deinococcus metalli]|uniref:Iron transporter n=1 Tax=Deinococcus metalli TaxID=1141878 RepID=A0A7W8KIJ5_9DEIO|nr:Nramp family divalent metal transporter [Deinococcus metalli]MBB5378540.1 NRAMP (natural resistance-associated macrophage protein)-like metal ion transporter [Deinococcus metalli]GHF58443.1 iron transporter [Deinococcus metalli]